MNAQAGPPDGPIAIAVTGVMASGKSTVAALLAERMPRSVHVRGDLFRRMIVNGRAPVEPGLAGTARAQLRLRHRLAAQAVDTYAQAGFGVVVQDVILGEMLPWFVGLVRTRPLAVVVLAPSVRAVERREAGRDKRGYVGGWTAQGLDRELREATPRLGLWLDTSDQTPAQTADAIWQRLGEAWVAGRP